MTKWHTGQPAVEYYAAVKRDDGSTDVPDEEDQEDSSSENEQDVGHRVRHASVCGTEEHLWSCGSASYTFSARAHKTTGAGLPWGGEPAEPWVGVGERLHSHCIPFCAT